MGDAVQASVLVEQWFWAAIGGGAAVLIGIIAGVAVAASSPPGMESPIEGNFEPGVLRW